MSFHKVRIRSVNQITKMTVELALLFLGIIVIAMGTTTYLLVKRSSKESRDKVVNLLYLNNQRKIYQLNLYLDKVEDTAALLFSDDQYCDYNAADASLDDFEKLKQEELVEQRLQELGIFQNFSDFGIVYSDDSTLGWLSNTTIELFPDGGLYTYLSDHVSDTVKESGWFFDYEKCYDRLYYVKRLNPDAVLVAAFYSRELAGTFSDLNAIEGLTTYLTNAEDTILYSDRRDDAGQSVWQVTEMEPITGDAKVVTDQTVMISGECSNGWQVYCVVLTNTLFSEEQSLVNYSLSITGTVMAVLLLIGCLCLIRMARRQSRMVSAIKRKAEYDQMTQIYNKQSYREMVDVSLLQRTDGEYLAFLMLDLDNFKKINDTYGHQAGDQLLIRVAGIFRTVFSDDALIGRVGGDEFSVCMTGLQGDRQKAGEQVETRVAQLMENMKDTFAKEYEQCGMSLSIGGYLFGAEEDVTYDLAYQRADRALYVSKRSGKAQMNWYER